MVILLNTGAGSNSESHEMESRIRRFFDAAGLRPELRFVRSDEVTAISKQAAAGRDDVIVAGGGDGTIGAVAAELAGTGKALGVLPLGSLNHFAKDLGIQQISKEPFKT